MYEFERMRKFAEEADFGGYNVEPNEVQMLARNQLRCLWTAYCIIADLEPDTLRYDEQLKELWMAVIENRQLLGSTDEFDDIDCFDMWIGEYLC